MSRPRRSSTRLKPRLPGPSVAYWQTSAPQAVGALIAVFAATDVADAEVDAFIAGFKPADTSFEPDGGTSSDSSPSPTPAAAPGEAGDGAGKVSPIARRLADKLGIDVSKIKGTGSHGRVSKEDVEAYAATLQGSATPAQPVAAAAAAVPTPTREKMTSMRSTIARRLLESKQSIPHYSLRSTSTSLRCWPGARD